MKYRGSGTQKDPEAARQLYEESLANSEQEHELENPAALVGLAVYHLEHTGNTKEVLANFF